jgi:hypothetical protein
MYQNNICLKELMTTHHMERKGLLALEQQFKERNIMSVKVEVTKRNTNCM